MSTCIVRKNEQGKLEGATASDERLFAKFRQKHEGMEVGDTLVWTWHAPRSIEYHRRFFAMLRVLFDSQEQFDDANDLRQWLTTGAGYCKFVPGPDGTLCAIPESIAFHKLDQPEFIVLFDRVWRFLDTLHCQAYLWPSSSHAVRWNAVERLRLEMGR